MFFGKKKRLKVLHIYRGGNLSCVAENSESFLILDFQDLIHAQAAAVSEITYPCCLALFLATDLPVSHPAVLHPEWDEPGSAGLDRCLS